MGDQTWAPNRRDFFKVAGALTVASGIAGGLSACGGDNPNRTTSTPTGGAASSAAPATTGPKEDGTITAGISYELGTNGFDPMTTSAALTLAANWHTLEGLTELEPTGQREVYAALAKELPVKVDDTTYEATLRDGAKFHDGKDVTADDVVFSFERVLNPDNKSLYRQFLPFIDSVTKKDEKTVTIKLKYPFSLLNDRLSVVKVVPKAIVEADVKAFDANPVGTGPYKMTDNGGASKELKFERFDDYTGPKPALAANMIWKILPDESARTNGLTSGAVQAIDSVPYLSIDAIKAQKSVESVQGFGLLFAMFNCGSAPFNDVKNRQGVMYAFDLEKAIATGLLGQASPPKCFVHAEHPSYKEAKVVYNGDVEKAKALFAETGLKEIRMLCTDHGWVKPITPILKESLEAAGLTVAFEQKKSSDVYNTIDGKPESFDLVIAPGDPTVFGNDADLLMRWWYAGDVWTDSRMHWKGSESYTQVQTKLDEATKVTGDEQKKIWGEIYDILSENVPLDPLLHRKTPTAWDDKTLVNFKPISLTGLSFVDVGTTK